MNSYTPASISNFLRERIASYKKEDIVYNYGTVSKVSDGVVRINGLGDLAFGELLEFSSGVYGMVMDLEENGVGAVLLDNSDVVGIGDQVRGVGRVCEMPVSEEMIGRVLDPVGRPLDKRPYSSDVYYPAERPAPPLFSRHSVDTPLETGIIAIDSMIPIGRGQRELIIGDRQTGKTTIALQTILNQKNEDVICIYCAIGQKASTVAHVIETLREGGAMDYTFVVAACASDSPAMQYLAPYSACAAGEYFMEQGRDVLVIYDDLSKHAVAYRTMSLLLHRPPGREAYPGDIFYLHSRLLERAARLNDAHGGGSLTALPIIETMSGNISSYIPTNVISITDGQIYLETELFNNDIRPAVNTGLSVSRVGRSAQPDAMKRVSSSLRIDLARYRELSVFARFGADMDPSTVKQLSRGKRLTMLFVQNNNTTYSLAEKVILLRAFRTDRFINIHPDDMKKSCASMLEFMHASHADIISEITETSALPDELKKRLDSALAEWNAE